MALLQAIVSLVGRSAGKIVTVLFDWAVIALFGRVEGRGKIWLSALVGAAAICPGPWSGGAESGGVRRGLRAVLGHALGHHGPLTVDRAGGAGPGRRRRGALALGPPWLALVRTSSQLVSKEVELARAELRADLAAELYMVKFLAGAAVGGVSGSICCWLRWCSAFRT